MSSQQETSNIFIASDHAGFALKNFLVERLREHGCLVEDMGAHTFAPEDDYPDFVTPCAQRVASENMREATAVASREGAQCGARGDVSEATTVASLAGASDGASREGRPVPREGDDDEGQDDATESARDADASRAFGIVIGGSGQGEAMAANRVHGIRAAVFYGRAEARENIDAAGTPARDTLDIVRLTRAHNDANVLSLGARFLSEEEALRVTLLFLATPFSGAARHARRISKY